jgi:gluconate 2-dehydrogenase gamma chain
MDGGTHSRRSFLLSTGSALGVAWLTSHWSEVVAAAEHAAHTQAANLPTKFSVLSAAEAAQVDAIAAQIIPSGATPGAREARVVLFIDRALATFFAPMAADFRRMLQQFVHGFEAQHPASGAFVSANAADQRAYLHSVEYSLFFHTMRQLTVLGFLTSPQYGGNKDGVGWKAIGFDDQHMFQPPFGYYDRDYPGFEAAKTEARA